MSDGTTQAAVKQSQSDDVDQSSGQHHLALHEVFESLSAISNATSLQQLLPQLARLIAQSVNARGSSVILFDVQANRITSLLRWGYSAHEIELLERARTELGPAGSPALAEVIRTREPLIRTPWDTPEHLYPTVSEWTETYWSGDIIVPFIWAGQIEGVAIVLPKDNEEPFGALQAEILQGVAHQAAGIIHHLGVVDAERNARRRTETLLSLSRTFSAATTVKAVYNSLAQAVKSLLDTDAVSIVVGEHSVFHHETANRRIACVGMSPEEVAIRDLILRERANLDSSIDNLASDSNQPIMIHGISSKVDDPRLRQDYMSNGVEDLLAVPVKLSDGSLHAVLYSWSRHRPIAVNDDVLRIAGIMANQAAASVERLQLVEAERRRRERSDVLADINQRFAGVSDPMALIQIAAGAVRRILRADHVTVCINDPAGNVPHALLSDGTDPETITRIMETAAWMKLCTDAADMSGSSASRVLPMDEAMTWTEYLSPESDEHGNLQRQIHAIALPVTSGEATSGVLHAWFHQAHSQVSPQDLESAESLLETLGMAIERVNLRARERREWNRAEMLLSVADALNRSVDMPAVSLAILQTVRQQLPGVHAALAHRDTDAESIWTVEPSVSFAEGRAFHDLLDMTWQTRTSRTGYIDEFSILTVPLVAGDDVAGILVLARAGKDAMTFEDHDISSSLAPQAADALQRARLYAISERTVAELVLLHDVGRAITHRRRLPDIFAYIFSETRNLLEFTTGLLALDGPNKDQLEMVATWGDVAEETLGERFPIDASIMGTVYRSHEPVVVDDVRAYPVAWGVQKAVWRSLVCVPLMTGAQSIGALLIGHSERDKFGREDVRLASLLAGQAGAAIYQAREAERQRELYRAGVEALAAAVDAKDSYTHSHSRQVAELSRRTAEALGLDPEEVERIELAGLLHDVGKIGIPDHILTKPGRLDPQERLLMIGHAALGARIVAAHPALAELSELILHHHEWHNGSGYPDGLRKDEVPIGSAIIGVADAFDSMTTYRPYRSSLSFDAACEELQKWSGVQFHPAVIDAFLSTLERSPGNLQVDEGPSMDMRPIRAADIIAPRVLTQVATEIVGITDFYPFLDRLQQIIQNELKYDDVHIFLTDDDENDMLLAASTIHSEMVGRLRISGGNVLAAEAARTRDVVNSGDILEDPRAGFIDLDSRSGLEVPLIVEGTLIGVLGAASADAHRFEARDEALMDAIARQIAPMVMVARLHDHTRHTASIDGLTGVMNHRAFYLRLEDMLASLDEWDNDLHLLVVDVVGLKAVNDVYGHLAGDRALIAVANALRSRVRGEDDVARYGGDEFVVIVRGTPRGGLQDLAARIIAPVEFTLEDGYSMNVRLRCGVATATSSAERAAELVARADARLYIDIQPTDRNHDTA